MLKSPKQIAKRIADKLASQEASTAVLVKYRGEKDFAESAAKKEGMSFKEHNALINSIAVELTELGIKAEIRPPKGMGIAIGITQVMPQDGIGWAVFDGGIDLSKMERESL